jgi:hypothetical protein
MMTEEAEMRPVDLKVLRCIRRYTEFFADLALQNYECLRFKPSLIAIACVVCARRTNRIKPLWNPHLESLTGYSFEKVEPCYKFV